MWSEFFKENPDILEINEGEIEEQSRLINNKVDIIERQIRGV